MPEANEIAPRPRRSGKRFVLFLLPLLLLGAAWGLARAGVLPVGKLAQTSPVARKALTALGLGPRVARKTQTAEAGPAAQVELPSPPVAPALSSPATPVRAKTAEERPKRLDNSAKVAKILASMDAADAARLLEKMPDAEAAPLLMKMKERTAGELLAALPESRAARLALYLRRYPN